MSTANCSWRKDTEQMPGEKLSDKKANILATGPPGCGKSTLLEKIARHCGKKAIGFFTRELRQGKRRTGFEIETIGGYKGVLAHRDIDGAGRVGPYGVDVWALERIAVPALTPPDSETIVIVDEIGKMEWMSESFQAAAWRVLEGPNPVVASIARKGHKDFDRLKNREDVRVIEMTPDNRDRLAGEIIGWIDSRFGSGTA